MFSKYGIVHTYTLEAGYNMCTRLAKVIFPESNVNSKPPDYFYQKLVRDPILPNIGEVSRKFEMQTQPSTYYFTQRDYENIGGEIIPTLLDLIDRNPHSRLANSPIKNLRVLLLSSESQDIRGLPNRGGTAFQKRGDHPMSDGLSVSNNQGKRRTNDSVHRSADYSPKYNRREKG